MKALALIAVVGATLLPSPANAAPPLCWGKTATKVGTPGDDVIYGNNSANVIHGMGGNDIIKGRGGDDRVCGGDGHDNVFGDKGDDRVGGDLGDDFLHGGIGGDRLNGSYGENVFDGGLGNDTMIAMNSYDVLSYDTAPGFVRVNLGTQGYYVQSAWLPPETASMPGGGGTDTVRNFSNLVGSQYGDDLIGRAGSYEVSIYGGRGWDDIFSGGSDWTRLFGNGGSDALSGGSGQDYIVGGAGSDWLNGFSGDDWLDTRDGLANDAALGHDGDDRCDTDEGDRREECES